MTDNPAQRAALLVAGTHQRCLQLAGDELLGPWGLLATRTALLSCLLDQTALDVRPAPAEAVRTHLEQALALLSVPAEDLDLHVDDAITARRWLSEILTTTTKLTS